MLMSKGVTTILLIVCVLTCAGLLQAQQQPESTSATVSGIELVRYKSESSSVHIQPARLDSKLGIAVRFEGTNDLHFYANKKTARGGYSLKIQGKSEDFEFGWPVFPQHSGFYDITQGKDVEVYVGNFAVFLPITALAASTKTT